MTGGTPTKFAQATTAWDYGASVRAFDQGGLKFAIFVIWKEFGDTAGKDGGFYDEHEVVSP